MTMVMPMAEEMKQWAREQKYVWGRRQDMSCMIPERAID